MSTKLRWFGIVLSLLYLVLMAVWLMWASKPTGETRWQEFIGLSLNNAGDYLAGMFSPLAFLWLVLGFFQQGEELRQNTEALRLQAEELRHSVEQQRQLVDVARAELDASLRTTEAARERMDRERREAEEAISPRFHVEAVQRMQAGDGRTKIIMNFRNIGHVCYDVRVELDAPPTCLQAAGHEWPVALNGGAFQVACFLVPPTEFAGGTLHIRYRTTTGRTGVSSYVVSIGENSSLTPVAIA